MNTEDLIQAALDKDYNRASEVFGDIMGTKVSDALEQEKISLANQVYNGIEEPDIDEDETEEFEADDLEDEEELEDEDDDEN